jgi:murein DD-endopeptidase MepM/ murein hydrolase activator NlpD
VSSSLLFGRIPRFLAFVVLLALLPEGAALAGSPTWRWPASAGQSGLIRPFVAPLMQYGAGHRGVDIEVPIGGRILAPAPGVVSFNGVVARIPTLVLDHGGGVRSTYQPVTSPLKVGESVKAGALIGLLTAPGGHCAPKQCLHWGVRNSAGYLDPIRFIRPAMPVLLPLSGVSPHPERRLASP